MVSKCMTPVLLEGAGAVDCLCLPKQIARLPLPQEIPIQEEVVDSRNSYFVVYFKKKKKFFFS